MNNPTKMILSVLMCLLMSCTKPTSPDEGDFPQLDGIFAYTAISESGYSDLYVKNQVSTINLSATWKISSRISYLFKGRQDAVLPRKRKWQMGHILLRHSKRSNSYLSYGRDKSRLHAAILRKRPARIQQGRASVFVRP